MERFCEREEHTILLCTHRLEDAERLCDRVMIINHGARVILGTVDDLRAKITESPVLEIGLVEISKEITDAVAAMENVSGVREERFHSRLLVSLDDLDETIPAMVRRIVNAGGLILSVRALRPSLEEAYLELVKEG